MTQENDVSKEYKKYNHKIFILYGCKKYEFFYTLGLGVRPNILTPPVTFYCGSPPLAIDDCCPSITAVCNKLFVVFRHEFSESDNYAYGRHTSAMNILLKKI